MHIFLKSIGYGKIKSEKIWNHYLKETEKTYTHHELVALDREIDFCEFRRECGTGIGISIAANKIHGIRAALCNDVYSAKMSRQHNNANVLAMGGRVTGFGPADEIVRAWLTTEFEGGRHERRVNKIMALEEKYK